MSIVDIWNWLINANLLIGLGALVLIIAAWGLLAEVCQFIERLRGGPQ